MTQTLDPPAATRMPIGRYEWERLVRRIVMPKEDKFLALLLATWADPDGSRVRPGSRWLANATGDSERTVRRHMGLLADHWGLIELVSRGGGRGGRGKTTEYRLTIPTDLLDRHVVLGPDGELDSPANMVSGDSAFPPDIQVSGDYDGGSESPDIQMAGQSDDAPVDNPVSPDTLVADENDFHRSSDVTSERMTGQIQRLTGHPACPTTTHITNHQSDQHLGHPPTQPPTAREPPDDERSSRPSSRCHHGLKSGRNPDGTPRCAFCRRENPGAAMNDLRRRSTT